MKRKKISQEQMERLNMLDENIRCFIEKTIDSMHTPFTPLKRSISPLIDKLQVHLDFYPNREKINVS